VPTLAPQTCKRLQRALPSYAVPENPVDLSGGLGGGDRETDAFAVALQALDDDPGIDIIVLTQMAVRKNHAEVFAPILDVARSLRKPVVLLSPGGSIAIPGMLPAHRSGVPLFESPERCARSLRHLCWYADYVRAHTRDDDRLGDRLKGIDHVSAAPTIPVGIINPGQTWRLLRERNLPLVRQESCANLAEVVAVAERIGYPVALKAITPNLLHKSEAGGVFLNLNTRPALEAAYSDLITRFGAGAVDVQEMVPAGVEMIVGIHHDEHFGPVVVAGSGGTLVELVGDTELAPVPLNRDQARSLIRGLRAYRLLTGFRGAPPADIDALLDLIVTVSDLAVALDGQIQSLDLNPVIVLPAGRGVRIVDAALIGRLQPPPASP
jgi:acetate---CoA ligase (ADP-forming)